MEHTTGTAPESMSFREERFKSGHFRRRRALRSSIAVAVMANLYVLPLAAEEWEITPTLEIEETYTDNVELVSQQENKTDDFVTRITPGISISGVGARASLDLTYSPSFLIFLDASENSDFRQFLNARGNAELSEDLVFLDLGASINQQFLDRGGAITSNQSNVNDNRRTIQNYTISPYIQRNLGTFATATLRYRASYTDSARPGTEVELNDILSDTYRHDASALLSSGQRFTRFRWDVEASYEKLDRQAGRADSETTTLRLLGTYVVNRMVSLVGSIGYEDFNDGTLQRRPDGVIWDAGVTLTPGPRTTLTVRGGRRYGDDNWSGDFTYEISERTRITAGYTEELSNSQSVLLDELINNPDGDVVDPGGFSLIGSGFKRKRAFTSLSGERGRSGFSVSGFWEKRVPDSGSRIEENYGGSVRFNHRFSRYLSGNVQGSYQNTEFSETQTREDDLYTGSAGLTYQLSQSISGGLTYIFTQRDSTEPFREIRENAVKVNVRATF